MICENGEIVICFMVIEGARLLDEKLTLEDSSRMNMHESFKAEPEQVPTAEQASSRQTLVGKTLARLGMGRATDVKPDNVFVPDETWDQMNVSERQLIHGFAKANHRPGKSVVMLSRTQLGRRRQQ